MPMRRFRLPSPALVIATIALALVLGGTAVAASTSAPLTKSSATKLVKQLAPQLSVKHAKTADNATTAGGQTVKKVQWKVAPGTTTQTIFSAGGLTIAGSCDAISNITVDATGPVANDGELRIQGNVSGTAFFKNVFQFGSATTVSVINGDVLQSEGSAQLVYATNDGHVVTFDYGFDTGTSGDKAYDGNFLGCTLYGEAVYS
jgi:hypothetical protein